MTSPWTKCPTTELSSLLPVLGHISLSWRNLSKRKVQRRMSRSILLSRHFVVKPVKTLFQSTNVCPTIECSTSPTLAARASLKLLSTRFENIHSETFHENHSLSYRLICVSFNWILNFFQSIIVLSIPVNYPGFNAHNERIPC